MRLFYVLTLAFFTHSRYIWIVTTMRFSSGCRNVALKYFAPGLVVAACGSDFTGKLFMLYIGNCLDLYVEHDLLRHIILGLACVAQLIAVILIPFVAFNFYSFIILIIVSEFSSGLMNHSLPMLFAYGFRDSYNFIGRALSLSNIAAGIGALIFSTIGGALIDWQNSFEVVYMFSAGSVAMYTVSYFMLELHVRRTWIGAKSWRAVIRPRSPAIKFAKARVVHEFGPSLPPYSVKPNLYSDGEVNAGRVSVDAPPPRLDRSPGRSRMKRTTTPVVIDEAALAQTTLSRVTRGSRTASILSIETMDAPTPPMESGRTQKQNQRLARMLGSGISDTGNNAGESGGTSTSSAVPLDFITDDITQQPRSSKKQKPVPWQELLHYNGSGGASPANAQSFQQQNAAPVQGASSRSQYAPLLLREVPENKPPNFGANGQPLARVSAQSPVETTTAVLREANSLVSITTTPFPAVRGTTNSNASDDNAAGPAAPRTRAGTLLFASPTPSVESDYDTAAESESSKRTAEQNE